MFFILITLIIYYILIFNNCFVNCNFEFIIKIKGIIGILKIISLIGHKVYEINLMGYNYLFFCLKLQFSQKNFRIVELSVHLSRLIKRKNMIRLIFFFCH